MVEIAVFFTQANIQKCLICKHRKYQIAGLLFGSSRSPYHTR
jgi:hypothetical protein